MSSFDNNNQNRNNPKRALTPNSSPKNNSDSIKQIQESIQNFLNGDLSANETKKLVNMVYDQIIAAVETQQTRYPNNGIKSLKTEGRKG